MTFRSSCQRKAVMARLSSNHNKVINNILQNPDTTVRTINIKGKPHLERRIMFEKDGVKKIVLERMPIRR